MEMIQTSKNHACVRKLYALSKDGERDLEMEFIPCVEFKQMEDKYKKSSSIAKRTFISYRIIH